MAMRFSIVPVPIVILSSSVIVGPFIGHVCSELVWSCVKEFVSNEAISECFYRSACRRITAVLFDFPCIVASPIVISTWVVGFLDFY